MTVLSIALVLGFFSSVTTGLFGFIFFSVIGAQALSPNSPMSPLGLYAMLAAAIPVSAMIVAGVIAIRLGRFQAAFLCGIAACGFAVLPFLLMLLGSMYLFGIL